MEEIEKYEKIPGIRKEFIEGLREFYAYNLTQARESFRKLELKRRANREPQLNLYLSYYGLTLVQLQENKGINLCRRAAHFVSPFEDYSIDVLYNLAIAELKLDHRRRVIDVVKRGLVINSSHIGLNKLQQQMGVRSEPIFSSLSRDNILNHVTGKLFPLRYRKSQ